MQSEGLVASLEEELSHPPEGLSQFAMEEVEGPKRAAGDSALLTEAGWSPCKMVTLGQCRRPLGGAKESLTTLNHKEGLLFCSIRLGNDIHPQPPPSEPLFQGPLFAAALTGCPGKELLWGQLRTFGFNPGNSLGYCLKQSVTFQGQWF